MYGTQAKVNRLCISKLFENDVKMYGTQALTPSEIQSGKFENDVKMYGTQAMNGKTLCTTSLRMM